MLPAPMPPNAWRMPPGSSSRSCASRPGRSALPSIPDAGWSSAPSPGSGETAGWRKTSRQPSPRQQPSSMPLPSCYSHDGSLVRFEIRVLTLRALPAARQRPTSLKPATLPAIQLVMTTGHPPHSTQVASAIANSPSTHLPIVSPNTQWDDPETRVPRPNANSSPVSHPNRTSGDRSAQRSYLQ